MAEHVTFGSAVDQFTETVHGLRAGDWDEPTPCPDWDVRELFHHALVELLWIPPLVAGETVEQVGDRFDGDVVAGDAVGAWQRAADAAKAAFTADDLAERSVHTSFGIQPAPDYLRDLTLEMLMHHWDLTSALGRPVQWSTEECAFLERVAEAFAPMRDGLADSGVIAAPLPTTDGMSRQAAVLATFGRTATPDPSS